MESILRVTTKDGEVHDLVRPERKDDEGWAYVYAILGNAVRWEELTK